MKSIEKKVAKVQKNFDKLHERVSELETKN